MSVYNSFSLQFAKWRYQSILGIKKITLIICTILLIISGFVYFAFENLGYNSIPVNQSITLNNLSTRAPNLEISKSETLSYKDGRRGYYLKVDNKIDNSFDAVGYFPFVYRILIRDANGQVIQSEVETVQDYLLPSSESFIVGPVSRNSGLSMEIEIDQELSKPIKFDTTKSKFSTIPRVIATNIKKPVIADLDPNSLVIEFRIENPTNYDIFNTEILYLINNADGNINGLGVIRETNLRSKEQREIKIITPAPLIGSDLTLEVIPSVNYINENNFELTSVE